MGLLTNIFYIFLFLLKLFLINKIFAENSDNNGGWLVFI